MTQELTLVPRDLPPPQPDTGTAAPSRPLRADARCRAEFLALADVPG